ncbi:MAG: hypothetical protein ABSC25_27105, partial [Roseiarcus sp.]
RARQQITRKRQNTQKISELEYEFPSRNPANEMTVNLESVPCRRSAVRRENALASRLRTFSPAIAER